jgi:predicted outer membrane protein
MRREHAGSQLGQARASGGGDSGDRNFARLDVLGHTKVTDDLKMMVNTGKVNVKIPSALDSDQQAKLDESFDDAYSRDPRQSQSAHS